MEADSTELGWEIFNHSVPVLIAYIEKWLPKLSLDQKNVYDHVQCLANNDRSKSTKGIFLDGPAGSGKKLFSSVSVASLRARNRVVLCVATSGIVAQNYEGGMTAHSMFRLPLDIHNDSAVWGISGGSQRAELIKEAVMIVFDESHKTLFHILDKSLRDLMMCNEPFGGKIVILAGDFRQIPPVVPRARNPKRRGLRFCSHVSDMVEVNKI